MARVVADSLHEAYYVRSYPSFSNHRSAASTNNSQLLRPSPFTLNRSQSPSNSSSSSTCPRSNSPDSYYYSQREGSRMRWLLSFGLFIPAIAAITGVLAWSVSAQMILGNKGEAHLMPSKAAFRFSQGPRDHEWHGLLNNEALDSGSPESKEDYDLTLDSMTPDPVSISSASPTLTSEKSSNKFNSSSLLPANSTTATTITTTTSSITSTTSTLTSFNTTDANVISKAVVVTTATKPITSTASSLLSSASTASPLTVGVVKSSSIIHRQIPSNTFTGNNSTVISHESVNNTINTVTPNVSEVKKKKSPGEHVAEVIDKLISERKYESKPKILVVAPPNKKTIDTILANAYTTASASTSSSSTSTTAAILATSATATTTIAPSEMAHESSRVKFEKNKVPSAIKSTFVVRTTTEGPLQTVALTAGDAESTTSTASSSSTVAETNLYSSTNYPQAILSKDAETVLAAAQILAARHKIIAMRREDQNSIPPMDITTPKPPTTPFSRINHMQFPPPRAMQSSSSQSSSPGKQKQLTQRLHRHDHVHPVVNPTVPPRNLNQRMEHVQQQQPQQQQHQSSRQQLHQEQLHTSANPIAMASQAVVTHVLPDARNMLINHHQQEPIQISPPQPLTVSHLHHQVPVFAAAAESQMPPLDSAASFQQQQHQHQQHQQLQQLQQQQQLPSPPLRFAQISPHQLPRPPQLHPHLIQLPPTPQQPPQIISLAQPVPQIPLGSFQPSIYQSTIAPSGPNGQGPYLGAMNNNEPVDESQLISHSQNTLPSNNGNYGGEESKKNTAMVQFHADDHQPSESGISKGLTLHFGGGPGGGGSQLITSPMGIFKTLLLPLLPKPRMNLNGKVVFGVVLEKGVGFGKQPSRPIYKSHHY